jgi:hypothetical protein
MKPTFASPDRARGLVMKGSKHAGAGSAAFCERDQPMTSQPTDSLDDIARSQLMVPQGSRPPGPARALLGWLPWEHAESLLANQAEGELSEAQRAGSARPSRR